MHRMLVYAGRLLVFFFVRFAFYGLERVCWSQLLIYPLPPGNRKSVVIFSRDILKPIVEMGPTCRKFALWLLCSLFLVRFAFWRVNKFVNVYPLLPTLYNSIRPWNPRTALRKQFAENGNNAPKIAASSVLFFSVRRVFLFFFVNWKYSMLLSLQSRKSVV